MLAVHAYLSWIQHTLKAPCLFQKTCRWSSHVGRGNVFAAVWIWSNCIVIRVPYAPCQEHEALLVPHRFEIRCRYPMFFRLVPVLYTLQASSDKPQSSSRSMNSVRAASYLHTRRLSARIAEMEYFTGHLILSISTLLVPTAMTMDSIA